MTVAGATRQTAGGLPHTAERRQEPPTHAALRPQPLATSVLALQRQVGNRAVRRLLLRAPKGRQPILKPGEGYDGLLHPYGKAVERALDQAQASAVKDFRAWMEGTFDEAMNSYNKGTWAREAGARAASFAGPAEARATVYAEMQRQIILATGAGNSDWVAIVERGADGSWIFRGNPKLEVQRSFVVKPDGSCYSGQGRDMWTGSDGAKTPNYEKLNRIGTASPSGAGAPAAGRPSPAEPPAPAGKRPAPSSDVAPEPGVAPGPEPGVAPGPEPPVTPGVGTDVAPEPEIVGGGGGAIKGGLMLGANIAVLVIMWWLGKKAAEEAQAHLQELVDTKLEPAVVKALRDRSSALDGLTAKDPDHILYANVTADYDETWAESGIAGTEDTHEFTDVRFVDMKFSTNKIGESNEIDRDDTNWVGVKTIWATRRVTYSFVIFDPAYEAEKARRLKDWDEYTKKNPRWRIKPTNVKGPDPDRWVHANLEIRNFYTDREIRMWEEAKRQERQRREDHERSKRPRVEVIH